ncbi:MAG: helix-turn-helix domain-containing protein [Arenicellales bacterium]
MKRRNKSDSRNATFDQEVREHRSKRRGRPRTRQDISSDDPAADIVATAAVLFAQNGYAGTTTGQIARKAGLQQSSLYYYFSNKSEILSALIYPLTRRQIEYLDYLKKVDRRAVFKLRHFIEFDVETLATAPVNVTEVLSTGTDADFEVFWRERDELTMGIDELLQTGISEGDLIDLDTATVAHGLICFSEGIQSWLHNQRPPQGGSSRPERPDTCRIASFLADWLIRGLLAKGRRPDVVRRGAQRVRDEVNTMTGHTS